ncbi:Mu transposase C-terminal domain-containing protein [Kitasatospora sp. NPDC004615]|uniref:Mu transposase C-terminal domain-containing protein n=1 Tax=Kitasatospora sp. NPDC004615 TaxID=3364017 RepID=UPI0036AA09B1
MSGGSGQRVLAVGAHIVFDGRAWQVVGVEGQLVRLAGERGEVATVLAGHLVAAQDFAVTSARPQAGVPQWGLFQTVPVREQEKALAWQRHIQEVEFGLVGGEGAAGVPRPQYDPLSRTLAEREQAKADELTALGWERVAVSTVQRMRLNYRRQGLWGLVDHRTTKPVSRTGRADEKVVAAVLEALRRQRGRSKGTVKGLMQLTRQMLDERYGVGAVKLPAQATFYRLVKALADPAELPGRPARTATASPGRPFTPAAALRPGEQVMLDSTRLDVMAVFADGTTGRPELTIALDVATRSILAAVLRPASTKAVDAALLLAEMAVPHPLRTAWPDALALSRAPVPYEDLLDADSRLEAAAGRPVVVPETVVVDRGRIFLSAAFLAACESLGISVQPTPPRRPTAKGHVERAFGSVNTLFCQHVAGHTGSNVLRRGSDSQREAVWSVAQLQDMLDQWITTEWQNRPTEGLRHPSMPATALTPNEMWGAMLGATGHVPLPLSGDDYIELLPVVWKPITERGIRLNHRTYDHPALNDYRGQPSSVTAQQGRWEVHHNPHDARRIWVRLGDGGFTPIPWIHADHVHQPFGDQLWQHLKDTVARRGDRDRHEADLAQALDDLLRRARTGTAHPREHALITRHAPAALPLHTDRPTGPDTVDDPGGQATRRGETRPRKRTTAAGNAGPGQQPNDRGHAVPRPRPAGAARAGTAAGEDEAPAALFDATAPWPTPVPPPGSPAPGGEDDEDGLDDAGPGWDDADDLDGADAGDAGFGLFDAAEEAQQW